MYVAESWAVLTLDRNHLAITNVSMLSFAWTSTENLVLFISSVASCFLLGCVKDMLRCCSQGISGHFEVSPVYVEGCALMEGDVF